MTKPRPIHIDLRDLTDDKIAEALPNMGACTYASPCIVGTLIPKRSRARLDRTTDGGSSANISALIGQALVVIPADQLPLARRLQSMFDMGTPEQFNAVLGEVRALPR